MAAYHRSRAPCATIDRPDYIGRAEPRILARLERAIRHHRLQAAHNLLEEALSAQPPEAVLRDVVQPLLARIDDADTRRVAVSLIEVRLLAHARGWEQTDGPTAVLACAPREEHAIDLIGLGLALAERRCRIHYLGAATPVAALRDAAFEQDAAIVVIGADTFDITRFERTELCALAEAVTLLATGDASEALADAVGAVALPADPVAATSQAADLARQESSRRKEDRSPGGA